MCLCMYGCVHYLAEVEDTNIQLELKLLAAMTPITAPYPMGAQNKNWPLPTQY